jgi:hypothetical protein
MRSSENLDMQLQFLTMGKPRENGSLTTNMQCLVFFLKLSTLAQLTDIDGNPRELEPGVGCPA